MTIRSKTKPGATEPEPAGTLQAPAPAAEWVPAPAVGRPLLAGGQTLGPGAYASFPLPAGPQGWGEAGPALRAFRRLAELWGLTMTGQLTLLGLRDTQKATYYRWLREAQAGTMAFHLDRDPLDRIGHLLAIFEALGHLFQDPGQADAWVRRPNAHPLFQGRAPLARLLGGGMADLIAVRAHLEAAREGLA